MGDPGTVDACEKHQGKNGYLGLVLWMQKFSLIYHTYILIVCVLCWGLVGTPVPEENSEMEQKLGSCAYTD